MTKRYLRLDIEYEFTGMNLFMLKDNIARILAEDIPYARIIFSRDTPNQTELDKPTQKVK